MKVENKIWALKELTLASGVAVKAQKLAKELSDLCAAQTQRIKDLEKFIDGVEIQK